MPDLSIKVGFSGSWSAENKKAKTRKNQGFMRVFCVAGAVNFEPYAYFLKSTRSFLSADRLMPWDDGSCTPPLSSGVLLHACKRSYVVI